MRRLLYLAIAVLAGVFILGTARAADPSATVSTGRNAGAQVRVVTAILEPSTHGLTAVE